jgi:hypothetical protein
MLAYVTLYEWLLVVLQMILPFTLAVSIAVACCNVQTSG